MVRTPGTPASRHRDPLRPRINVPALKPIPHVASTSRGVNKRRIIFLPSRATPCKNPPLPQGQRTPKPQKETSLSLTEPDLSWLDDKSTEFTRETADERKITDRIGREGRREEEKNCQTFQNDQRTDTVNPKVSNLSVSARSCENKNFTLVSKTPPLIERRSGKIVKYFKLTQSKECPLHIVKLKHLFPQSTRSKTDPCCRSSSCINTNNNDLVQTAQSDGDPINQSECTSTPPIVPPDVSEQRATTASPPGNFVRRDTATSSTANSARRAAAATLTANGRVFSASATSQSPRKNVPCKGPVNSAVNRNNRLNHHLEQNLHGN